MTRIGGGSSNIGAGSGDILPDEGWEDIRPDEDED